MNLSLSWSNKKMKNIDIMPVKTLLNGINDVLYGLNAMIQ